MATFNLVRNSRVFFTTNLTAANKVNETGNNAFTAANTQELQVLDGFSFSQATNADTITIAEAGSTPVRGQRSFNTSLGNVEFSFSTYIRPSYNSTNVKAEEGTLWNALLATSAIGVELTLGTPSAITFTNATSGAAAKIVVTTASASSTTMPVGSIFIVKGVVGVGASKLNTAVKVTAVTNTTSVELTYITAPPAATATVFGSWAAAKLSQAAWNENIAVAADVAPAGIPGAYTSLSTALSNKNQLLPFGMVVIVDGITYVFDNCAMDQAVVDFGLDGIATVAWTGKGMNLRQLATTMTANAGTFTGGGVTGTANYTQKNVNANFITNKLSTITLISTIGGLGTAPQTYTLALTGGSITIANGITYVTPANLGTVNIPIGYYTGTRAVSGSLQAYLRTGTLNSAGLLATMLTNSATDIEPKYRLQIEIGGLSNLVRVEVEAPAAMVQIPTIDAQAVMSTTINFTAQGYDNVLLGTTSAYDIESTNDLSIRYFSN